MKLKILIINFLLLNFLSLFSQINNIKFEHFGVQHGLSSSSITSILKDKQGFLWIGTVNGLNRYDGYNFKQFKYNENDSTSLSDNTITFIYQDINNNIWIGTKAGGLNKFIPETETFFHLLNKNNDKFSLFNNLTRQLYENSSNKSILVVDGFIQILKNNKFYPFLNSNIFLNYFDKKYKILNQGPKFIFEEKPDVYWIGTWLNGLFLFNKNNNKIENIFNNDNIGTNQFSCYLKTKNNDLWFGTWEKGLFYFNRSLNKLINYPIQSEGNFITKISSIFEDQNNTIWVATESNGIFLIYPNDKKSFSYHTISKTKNQTSLSSNRVKTFYQEKNGTIWIGTGSGLNKYVPFKEKITFLQKESDNPNSLSNNSITCITEDNNKNIWIGTWGGGINKFNPLTNIFIPYKNNSLTKNSIPDNNIRSILKDSKGFLWIATRNNGIIKLNPNTNNFSTHLAKNSTNNPINGELISNFLIDKEDIFYIGYENNLFIDVYNINNNSLQTIISDTNNKINNIISILQSNDSTIWAASNWRGIFKINKYNYKINAIFNSSNDLPINFQLKHASIQKLFKQNNNIWASSVIYYTYRITNDTVFNYKFITNTYFIDSKNNFWLGTKSGLKKYIPEKDSFITYSEINDLSGNEIYSIIEDKNGLLWLGTNYGLCNFNPVNNTFKSFNEEDGIQDYYFGRSIAFKTSSNHILIASENGVNVFHPDSIKYNHHIPPIVFTDLKLFNKSVKIGEKYNHNVILPKALNLLSQIKLTHLQYIFSIDFAALDYISPAKNTYKYILEGFEKEWTTTKNHTVNYTNLNPGEYKLKVLASNNDGYWTSKPAVLTIIILPPFWKTWWFRILIVLLIISTFIAFFLYRTANIRQQNKILNDKVRERTMQILEKNEELLSQNEHIEEQKKELEKLNATKDKLFSIIAHDLKNPFNAISGFASLLINNFDNYSNSQKIELIKLIDSSSHNAYDLLENLLHWSRANLNVIKYNPSIIDVNFFIKENIQFLQIIAKNKDITILYSEKNITAYADKDMVNTVIRNLLANALKFTPSYGKIEILLTEDFDYTIISIKDSGVGMDKTKLSKLFRVDQNLSTSGTEGEKGTGIGLVLCKEFIDKNNGKIDVISEPGKGSTFTVKFPKS